MRLPHRDPFLARCPLEIPPRQSVATLIRTRRARFGLWTASLLVLWAVACENPLAPDACGPIPAVTVHVGETSRVTACFNDPNGDMLSYTVASSNPSVATASITGTAITVAGVAPGNATVTLTARDTGGLEGSQSFAVTVPNRAPQPQGTPPNVTVQVGDAATVDAAQYFSESDGETLTYTATASDTEAASVTVAGSVVTVTAEAKGSATVTITARDPGGLSARQTFDVTVPNRAPAATAGIADRTVTAGASESVDLAEHFSDPDGDALTYSAESSAPGVATAPVSGASLAITGVSGGTATITVTASDPDGLSAEQTFEVTVPNRPPMPVGTLQPKTVEVGQTATLDVADSFSDPDGDALTYSASSSRTSVATASVAGSVVTVTAEAKGTATVTIAASDPGGLLARQTFEVTVPNRPPVAVGTLPPQTVEVGQTATLDVADSFRDPDGDVLTYRATSSILAVARTSVSGSVVTITAVGPGTATVTITASDDERATATQQVSVTVPQPNRPPRRVGSWWRKRGPVF